MSVLIKSRCTTCMFGRRFRKYALVFWFSTAYMLILGLLRYSGNVQGLFVYTDSQYMWTFQKKIMTMKKPVTHAYDISSTDTFAVQTEITLKPRFAKFFKSENNSFKIPIETYYVIENRGLCSEAENLSVVIMVHTAPTNFINRMTIRKTWGNNSYYSDFGTTRLLFLLGRVSNTSLQLKIEKEFKQFGDVVQGDFVDSYYNLTLKGTMGFKWLSERCRNAKVVLKVDDDVIVNMFIFLTNFLPSFLSRPRHMACRRLHKAGIQRNKNSKWGIEEYLFKGERFYPDYCQGFIVIISNDVIPDLVTSTSLTPFFWIDDIFSYGLVPDNVPQMQYTNIGIDKTVVFGANAGIKCYQRLDCTCLAILLWADIPQKMEMIWKMMDRNFRWKQPVDDKLNLLNFLIKTKYSFV